MRGMQPAIPFKHRLGSKVRYMDPHIGETARVVARLEDPDHESHFETADDTVYYIVGGDFFETARANELHAVS